MPWEHEMLLPCDAAGDIRHWLRNQHPLAWVLVDSARAFV